MWEGNGPDKPVWERRLRRPAYVVLASVGVAGALVAADGAYLILHPLAWLVLAFAVLVVAGLAALTFALFPCRRARDQLRQADHG